MKKKKITIVENIGYSIGDISGNLLFQILMVVLLKIISDAIGMTGAVYASIAYVVIVAVCGYCVIPYFFRKKPIIAISTLFTYVATGVRYSSLGFYFQDYVNPQVLTGWMNQWGISVSREDAFTTGLAVFMVLGAIMQFLGVFLFSLFWEKHGKNKEVYFLCLIITAFLTAICYLPQPDDITLIYLVSMMKSLTFAPTVPLLWAMTHNMVDGKEYSLNCHPTGFRFFGVTSFMKAGLGLGGALTGMLLLYFGYVTVTVDALSWHTIQSIRWVSSIIPALLYAFGGIIILKFMNTASK